MAEGAFRVVIADDNADVRLLLTRALERSGRFEVVQNAANGPAAVEAARAAQPDLVLLDLAMPGGGGLEVLPALRAAAPDARVVIVSGFPGERLAEVVRERGAVGYVQKGLSPRRMVDEVVAVAGVLDAVEAILRSTRSLAADVASSAAARRFMEETLDRWACGDVLDVVNLLVTELVTNAVIHGGSESEVAVVLTAEWLRVEVGDNDPSVPAPKRADDDWATSGRGLGLVETLSQRWGIERRAGGKVIWFELARPDALGAPQ